jgi:hypothetical protein
MNNDNNYALLIFFTSLACFGSNEAPSGGWAIHKLQGLLLFAVGWRMMLGPSLNSMLYQKCYVINDDKVTVKV